MGCDKMILSRLIFLLLICVGATVFAGDRDDLTHNIEVMLKPAPAVDLVIPGRPEIQKALSIITGEQAIGMAAILERAPVYMELVESQIQEKKLPPGLVAVLIQESAFQADAVSSTGAAGLWQIKPATGRLFGLAHDAFIDERFDPEISTKSALDYLSALHLQFGNWPAALAAYNWGKGALAACFAANNSRDFWSLAQGGQIRKETTNYVPLIYAKLAVWRNPEKYGFEKPTAKRLIRFNLPPLIDISLLEKILGIDGGEIRRLNPQLRTGYTPSYENGGRIWVYESIAELLIAQQAKGFEVFQADPNHLHGVKKHLHKVKAGETVWRIGQKYDTCTKSILLFNGWTEAPTLSPGMEVTVFIKMEN